MSRQRAPESGRIIEASGLTVRRGRRTILRGIDVGIGESEILTLVGPNGAGKTTLLRALIGLETPAAGTLRCVPRMRVGYVPQHFSVDRNLPLPVERFLSLAGPSWKQAAQELGVESLLTRPLQALSGGELRHVLLARALARRPDILALDEPGAGLDHGSQTELYRLIQLLRDRYRFGVLIISHDLHLVMAASDQVLCLGHGRICCRGAPASVQEHPEYRALFGSELGPATGVYPHAQHAHPEAPREQEASHARHG